ncbi:hypothetical protein [Treponema sp.]|uniref:hypothetical protein n=1 Tax=Treponema sp. TaxID=166 RepID=UPI00298EB8F5|nr:hypothetical protein [Treponema sp.]MCR5613235.1 hypothetical protein [Treponema sp.]
MTIERKDEKTFDELILTLKDACLNTINVAIKDERYREASELLVLLDNFMIFLNKYLEKEKPCDESNDKPDFDCF